MLAYYNNCYFYLKQLLVLAVVATTFPRLVESGAESVPSRNVVALSNWAEQNGITMHPSVQWKQYSLSYDEGDNWGLELKEPLPPGTTLLSVPRNLVWDAARIYEEVVAARDNDDECPTKLERAFERLGDFVVHKEVFLLFLKMVRCSSMESLADGLLWSPWIQSLPKTFPAMFTTMEQECLPYYAKYAAQYQDKKFKAFCQALSELDNDGKEYSTTAAQRLRWAFHAVGSRCWKTQPADTEDSPNTELVPVGDMFNHREPPNVAITHSPTDGSVNFVYMGDSDENNKDLFITYGQPSNPHRFLAVFGFVPEDMPQVWSHVTYADNPFSADVSKMVFGAGDGTIAETVWDAVLYALLQPPPGSTTPVYTQQHHAKYKKHTVNILQNHVANLLEELASLRHKMETTSGDNMDLIRRHNDFLTKVLTRVKGNLKGDLGD